MSDGTYGGTGRARRAGGAGFTAGTLGTLGTSCAGGTSFTLEGGKTG